MPKKWVKSRGGPEQKEYWVEVEVFELKKVKKGEVPEPPPNFTPGELDSLAEEPQHRIFSHAQASHEALEKIEN